MILSQVSFFVLIQTTYKSDVFVSSLITNLWYIYIPKYRNKRGHQFSYINTTFQKYSLSIRHLPHVLLFLLSVSRPVVVEVDLITLHRHLVDPEEMAHTLNLFSIFLSAIFHVL